MRYLVKGPPTAKARARMGPNGNWYTPPTTRAYEETIAWHVRQEGKSFGKEPVALRAEFYTGNGKLVDVDNLLKALLDGCEKGGLFDNDKQVVELGARIYFSDDDPRTEFEVTPVSESPHSIYCGARRSSVEWVNEEWVCSTCGESLVWMVT